MRQITMKQLWEINGGKDYDENERNIYRLYIPYSAYLRKEKNEEIGLIFLFMEVDGLKEQKKALNILLQDMQNLDI